MLSSCIRSDQKVFENQKVNETFVHFYNNFNFSNEMLILIAFLQFYDKTTTVSMSWMFKTPRCTPKGVGHCVPVPWLEFHFLPRLP